MATPEATTKGNLSSCPVRADGGAPRRRRAPRRGATRSRHTRASGRGQQHAPVAGLSVL